MNMVYTSCLTSYFLLLMLCLVSLSLFGTVASLKVPAMIVYHMATNVLDTEIFPQHTLADLNSGITFIVLFSQEKPLQ